MGSTAVLSANVRVAGKLRQMADLLAQQGGNPFRETAYRRAADTVAHLDPDLGELLEDQLPHVGRGIAAAIREMLRTRH